MGNPFSPERRSSGKYGSPHLHRISDTPPPSFLITEIEQTFQSLSSNLASEGQYLASVAFAGYNYLAGKQGTQELVDDAVQLQEVADQAVGTSEEISTAVAASDGWALAGDSAVSDIFNLEDLMSALIGD
jgi:hypothetical protein